jgi:flagellar biosynthetic protein FliR
MDFDFNNGMLVFVRAGAFMSILPFFTMFNVPPMVRVALAALLAVLVAPTLPPFHIGAMALFDLTGLFAREIVSGLLIGFVTRMVFFAADLGGQIITNEVGLSLASVFDPVNARPTQAPVMIMGLLTCLLMMLLDMHHWLLTGFQYTYTLLPIGGAQFREVLFTNILDHTSRVFLVGVQIAGPVMAASFLAMLLLGFLGRLVPQMNVFAESFVVRIGCGLVVFALTLEISAQHIINGLHRLPDDMLRVAQFLGVA